MFKALKTLPYTIFSALALVMLAACGDDTSKIAFSELPPQESWDAERGEEIYHKDYKGTPACSSCHLMDDESGSPEMANYAFRADKRVEGMSAVEYTFYSIVEPGRHLVPDYGNAMYNGYDNKLTPQEIGDLIAYLLTLRTD
jgi:mono/diheme cytochrome c family protein